MQLDSAATLRIKPVFASLENLKEFLVKETISSTFVVKIKNVSALRIFVVSKN